MLHNFTIDHQLNHRTIRKFKDQPLTEEQLTTLFEVARQTSSSEFLQQMTIIRVTDPQNGPRFVPSVPSHMLGQKANC